MTTTKEEVMWEGAFWIYTIISFFNTFSPPLLVCVLKKILVF